MKNKLHIAILGGGPSGLFMYKRLVEASIADLSVSIFEKKNQLGAGMPYSTEGANDEHITNVSGNEIPLLVTTIAEWLKTVLQETLDRFKISPEKYNDYKVLPRLLFGQYLSAQFDLLQQLADKSGIETSIHYNSLVTDITDEPGQNQVIVEIEGDEKFAFDQVIVCTGHNWPTMHEGKVPGYFDSPYPPSKLRFKADHSVAIKGASLTAIDAIRTLARHNGSFFKDGDGKLAYRLADESPNFRLVIHSRNGMLPAIRFHLEDSHLSKNSLLSHDEMRKYRDENDGFLPLDLIFEKNFKDQFREKHPEFYDQIRDMTLEDFVAHMMDLRERLDPFLLFKAEYTEAEKSIKRRESVYWKEMLAVLSFAMNYPAKYLSAEDMQRLQKVLMPLISIVIAFVPQSSCEELLALHQAGVLEIIPVGDDSYTEPHTAGGAIYHYTDDNDKLQAPHYNTFVNCVGQPHLTYKDLPYPGLLSKQTVSPAKLKFRNAEAAQAAMEQEGHHIETDGTGNYYLQVPGITINDDFQVVDEYGAFNNRIYMMSVPYIGGYNPDYSGLDFCEAASERIVNSLFKNRPTYEQTA